MEPQWTDEKILPDNLVDLLEKEDQSHSDTEEDEELCYESSDELDVE